MKQNKKEDFEIRPSNKCDLVLRFMGNDQLKVIHCTAEPIYSTLTWTS